MSSSESRVTYEKLPAKVSWRLFDMSGSDATFVFCAIAVTLTTFVVHAPGIVKIVVPCVFGVLFCRFDMGRGYQLVAHALQNARITVVKRGVLWQAPRQSHNATQRRARLPKRPPPIRLGISGAVTRGGMLGLISQPDKKTDNFVVVGHGSNIASQEVQAQSNSLQAFAETIKRVASEVPFPIGVSYVFTRRPMDYTAQNRYITENYDGAITVPEALLKPREQWSRVDELNMAVNAHQGELLTMSRVASSDVTMAAVVTVKRHPKWRKAAKTGKLPIKDIDQSPVAQMARSFATDLLGLDVSGARVLNYCDTSDYVHRAWDVVRREQYDAARRNGGIPTTDDRLAMKRNKVISDMYTFPAEHIMAWRDGCVMDGTFHSTIRFTACPELALPTFFMKLRDQRIRWSSITLCGETLSGRRESIQLTYGISLVRAFDQARSRTYRTPAEQERRSSLEERHVQQHKTGSVLQLYNILVSVSADSREQLDMERSRMLAVCRSMKGVKAKVVHGARWQIPALLSATTGVNHL